MAEVRTVQVDMVAVDRLVRRMLAQCDGARHVDIEAACVWAYLNVAGGVREYPAATRTERISIAAQAILKASAEAVVMVAALPDHAVTETRTCH